MSKMCKTLGKCVWGGGYRDLKRSKNASHVDYQTTTHITAKKIYKLPSGNNKMLWEFRGKENHFLDERFHRRDGIQLNRALTLG